MPGDGTAWELGKYEAPIKEWHDTYVNDRGASLDAFVSRCVSKGGLGYTRLKEYCTAASARIDLAESAKNWSTSNDQS
jgi:hypothetical protein